MSTTLLTSIFSLFAMAAADFLVVFTVFKSKFRSPVDISFANCWMAIGVVHFFMALRTAFFGLGLVDFDQALAYIVQLLIAFVLLAIGHHVALISFENKVIRSIFYIFVFGSTISFLVLFLNYGLSGPLVSEWGSEYSAAWQANLVLIVGSSVAGLALIYSLAKYIRSYKRTGDLKRVLTIVSLLLYFLFGVLEQLGNVGWEVLLVRVLNLVVILTAYSAYELEKYKV